ncbi:exodeoxyribonuclease III [Candidatus Woesearchaeota archaeon]|nr:exodeoxyribonuclease III [Candidatus Woesearchaeota archaeon]
MKIISWNVNGIRAVLGKNFAGFLREQNPDIMCLQETKAQREQVGHSFAGYDEFWHAAEKKGYSGTAILTRTKPLAEKRGLGKHDHEGRVLTLEFPDYFLINVYTPNSQRGLLRLDYRMDWDKDFLAHVSRLDALKPVIFCGDLNVAHKEIDIANPESNRRNPGFTDEERRNFSRLLEAGFIDTFRELNKEPHHYTWWLYMNNCRARNIGWRIDYFCMSHRLRPHLKEAFILPHVMGSDHCPVGIII